MISQKFAGDGGARERRVPSKHKMQFRSRPGANFRLILILITFSIVGITIRIQFDIRILTPKNF
jgi:hypothetical protein